MTFTGITLNGKTVDRARAIYELRKARGLTRKELAEISHASASSIVRYEKSTYKGQDATYLKILAALGGRLEVNISITTDDAAEMLEAQ